MISQAVVCRLRDWALSCGLLDPYRAKRQEERVPALIIDAEDQRTYWSSQGLLGSRLRQFMLLMRAYGFLSWPTNGFKDLPFLLPEDLKTVSDLAYIKASQHPLRVTAHETFTSHDRAERSRADNARPFDPMGDYQVPPTSPGRQLILRTLCLVRKEFPINIGSVSVAPPPLLLAWPSIKETTLTQEPYPRSRILKHQRNEREAPSPRGVALFMSHK
ncbi:hypothetical protein E4U43_002727 [Claviceps pusilla]|uniref:Uncharacterized protein n=1 Tax=Claviceps pusilla TaxID=123648 RepID=A0A9P7N6F3_9HYPO|nr:hypothetical protein E4U43_002727 [Claviceps pusilla]